MATTSKNSRSEPWDRSNPKKKSGPSKHLSASVKEAAKCSAQKAGWPYPNLVDNMRAARKDRRQDHEQAKCR